VKPLTPPDCDLRDFPRMMIDIPRLRGSAFDETTDDTAWRAGVNLWFSSWHRIPAASLPNTDEGLAKAAGLGRDVRTWRQVRSIALRGWEEADDGLLYHATVAEVALEAWLEKLTQRLSSGAGNASRWGSEFDPEPIRDDMTVAAGLLFALNPKSKAFSKQQTNHALRRSQRDCPTAVPLASDPVSQRDNKIVPTGLLARSQGKGREGKEEERGRPGGSESPSVGRIPAKGRRS